MNPNPTQISAKLRAPSKWTRYDPANCGKCYALCCYLLVEVTDQDLVRLGVLTEFHLELTDKERIRDAVKSPIVQRFSQASQKYTLRQTVEGACCLLTPDHRCSRYNDRPDTCRQHPHIGPKPGFCPFCYKKG